MTLNLLQNIFLALVMLGLTAALLFFLDLNPIRAVSRWREERRFTEHAVLCRRCFVTALATPKLPDKYLCPEGRAITGAVERTDHPN